MPKSKPHKGILKRVRITSSGKVKYARSGGRHLRSHKSGKRLRSYRRKSYAGAAEARRVGRLIGRSLRRARFPDECSHACACAAVAPVPAGIDR